MDFFDHQDRARRNTLLLIVYFAIAVVLVIAAVYAAVLTVAVFVTRHSEHPIQFWDWHPLLATAVVSVVSAMIAIGSIYKIWSLGSHGEHVAMALGGEKVPPNTRVLEERILLNVVEEMALASGTPVPPVYVLSQESGINAFAAGTSPQNAVIGITRGALMTLNREELQGVIAHEFSHILNGDMRLNLRLIGLLNGILLIALTGYVILRLLGEAGIRSSGGSSKDNKGALGMIAAIVAVGASLVAIGYIGVFFANLIKAAVSRQREFLADASAVQFTRNPQGISNALKRIGGWSQHSKLATPRATEASHMFFGEGVVSRLFATHPDLTTRIRRIDPQFKGSYQPTSRITHSESELIDPRSLMLARSAPSDVHRAAEAGANFHEQEPAVAVMQIGEPTPDHLDHAQHLVDEMGALLESDVRDPLGAVAIVYALLLAPPNEPIRDQQKKHVADLKDERIVFELNRVLPFVDALQAEKRLPLACMALPALHQMSPQQIHRFGVTVRKLIEADRNWSIFEFGIQRYISKRLVQRLDDGHHKKNDASAMSQTRAFNLLLSSLAHLGSDAHFAQQAFAAGLAATQSSSQNPSMLPREACTLKAMDIAMEVLEKASNPVKRKMLLAFSACIAADGRVDVCELELLRIISDALGCPMPPILNHPSSTSST
jgi:Zn-dependent protease with chaperone function